MLEIGFDNFYIELVENYPCDNKDQLRAREGFFIRERATLNHMIEGRTRKEREEEERDRINASKRETRLKKLEQYKEMAKNWRDNNHDKVLDQKQRYRETYREQINMKQNEKVRCECGCEFARVNISRHIKTKKHLELMAKLNEQSQTESST
jgi:hypothetical protein